MSISPDTALMAGDWRGRAFSRVPKSRVTASFNERTDNVERVVNLMGPELALFYSRIDPTFVTNFPEKARRVLTQPPSPLSPNAIVNKEHNFILRVDDLIISERSSYHVIDMLGTGSFGQVVKCKEKNTGRLFAIKLIKNLPAYHKQGAVEIKILKKLKKKTDRDVPLLVLEDYFLFQGHLCLVSELLGASLYDLLKLNKFRGISTKLVRSFMSQILTALDVLDQVGILHCDLKPENILLQDSSTPALKVIDFGSACFRGNPMYSYIQSRFYRAPEVILGLPYSSGIDIWSAACVCFELFWGLPLFPGQNQHRMLVRFERALGAAPYSFLSNCKFIRKYYNLDIRGYFLKSDSEYAAANPDKPPPGEFRDYFKGKKRIEHIINSANLRDSSRSAASEEKEALTHFLLSMLQWEASKRWTPSELLTHPFISCKSMSTLKPHSSPESLPQSRSLPLSMFERPIHYSVLPETATAVDDIQPFGISIPIPTNDQGQNQTIAPQQSQIYLGGAHSHSGEFDIVPLAYSLPYPLSTSDQSGFSPSSGRATTGSAFPPDAHRAVPFTPSSNELDTFLCPRSELSLSGGYIPLSTEGRNLSTSTGSDELLFQMDHDPNDSPNATFGHIYSQQLSPHYYYSPISASVPQSQFIPQSADPISALSRSFDELSLRSSTYLISPTSQLHTHLSQPSLPTPPGFVSPPYPPVYKQSTTAPQGRPEMLQSNSSSSPLSYANSRSHHSYPGLRNRRQPHRGGITTGRGRDSPPPQNIPMASRSRSRQYRNGMREDITIANNGPFKR